MRAEGKPACCEEVTGAPHFAPAHHGSQLRSVNPEPSIASILKPPKKQGPEERQDRGDAERRDSQPARLEAWGLSDDCTTTKLLLYYYCTTLVLITKAASILYH